MLHFGSKIKAHRKRKYVEDSNSSDEENEPLPKCISLEPGYNDLDEVNWYVTIMSIMNYITIYNRTYHLIFGIQEEHAIITLFKC